EAPGLEHERLQLALLARVLPRAGAGALLEDHLLERGRRLLPHLAADEGARRLAVEAGLAIALAGAAVLAGLLEHLARDAHAARGEEALRRALVLALGRQDRRGGVVVAGLEVQLGGLEEAVLVVADAGGAHVVARLGEELRGAVEQARVGAQLRGLHHHALARHRERLALELAGEPAVDDRLGLEGAPAT